MTRFYSFFVFVLFILSDVYAQGVIIPTNHVEGTIYDLRTNNPIANATVVIEFGVDKYTSVTNAEGKYNIKTSVRYGDKEYYIKIIHKNYYDLNGVVFVKEHSIRNFGLKEKIIPITTFIKDSTIIPSISLDGYASNNWTILIDISSSMNEPEKLNVLLSGIKNIVELFRAEDIITILTFSSKTNELLPSTSGNEKNKILLALDKIKFGGTTQGASAIESAFQYTSKNYIDNGNNRILIFTDGMFSSGKSDYSKISKTISTFSNKNIKTSIFLLGNPTPYVIKNQENLTKQGNGSFAVLKDAETAKKIMIEEAQKVKK